jgi:hypothetical protein
MIIFEFGNVRTFKEFVGIPKIKWHSLVHRVDKDIQMCDI